MGGAENFSYYGIFLIFGSWLPIDPLSSQIKSQEYVFTLRSKIAPVIWGDFDFGFLVFYRRDTGCMDLDGLLDAFWH